MRRLVMDQAVELGVWVHFITIPEADFYGHQVQAIAG